MKVVYIRFQDFKKRFYISSEREIVRSFNRLKTNSLLLAFGEKKNEPDFVKLFSSFKNIKFLIKLNIAKFILRFKNKKTIFVFDVNSTMIFIGNFIYRKIFGGKNRFILDVRSIPVVDPSKKDIIRFKISLRISKHFFDGFSFITEETRRICEVFIKKKFKTYVVYPSGFNEEIFYVKEKRDDILKKFNIENKKIIFYHGSISKKRGLEELSKSVERLKLSDKNIVLFVVGGGDGEMEEMLRSSGNILIPPVAYESIPDYISIADVCVSPLPDLVWWRGASSLKVMEYMAMGKPMVLSDIKPHRDVLPDGIKGYVLYEPSCWENLYKALKKFFDEEESYKKESFRLSEYAHKNFSYDLIASKVLKFYKESIYRENG